MSRHAPLTLGTLALLAALVGSSVGCGAGGSSSSGGALGSASRAPTFLSVHASAQSPKVGTTFTVEVDAARTIRDVFGGGFEVRYDPAVVEYVSTDTTRSRLVATKDAAALRGGRAGALVFGRTQEGAAASGDVTGEIATFTFRAKAAGAAALRVEAPQFVTGAGADIAMSAPPGVSVTVAP